MLLKGTERYGILFFSPAFWRGSVALFGGDAEWSRLVVHGGSDQLQITVMYNLWQNACLWLIHHFNGSLKASGRNKAEENEGDAFSFPQRLTCHWSNVLFFDSYEWMALKFITHWHWPMHTVYQKDNSCTAYRCSFTLIYYWMSVNIFDTEGNSLFTLLTCFCRKCIGLFSISSL